MNKTVKIFMTMAIIALGMQSNPAHGFITVPQNTIHQAEGIAAQRNGSFISAKNALYLAAAGLALYGAKKVYDYIDPIQKVKNCWNYGWRLFAKNGNNGPSNANSTSVIPINNLISATLDTVSTPANTPLTLPTAQPPLKEFTWEKNSINILALFKFNLNFKYQFESLHDCQKDKIIETIFNNVTKINVKTLTLGELFKTIKSDVDLYKLPKPGKSPESKYVLVELEDKFPVTAGTATINTDGFVWNVTYDNLATFLCFNTTYAQQYKYSNSTQKSMFKNSINSSENIFTFDDTCKNFEFIFGKVGSS